jgi:hypothetical protein
MTLKRLLATAAVLVATGTAVQAAPFCTDMRSGVRIEFGFSFGQVFTESEQNDFDLMELRRRGVDATRVERWNGCIRAFVRQPGGGERMEFYDPNTFEQVF